MLTTEFLIASQFASTFKHKAKLFSRVHPPFWRWRTALLAQVSRDNFFFSITKLFSGFDDNRVCRKIFVSNFWLGFGSKISLAFAPFMSLSIVWRQGFPLFARQWLGITDVQPAHRARNSNIFGSDKCYKHCLCGGGCCNDCCSMDTSKGGGLGKFVTRRGRSVSKRKIPRNSFNKTTVNVY